MPAASQVKLLRVIEGNSFRRLRGSQEILVNVRIVAAMGSDPMAAIREGRLRADLYYRLNVFTLELPRLKERLTDVPLLAKYFIRQFNRDNGKSVGGLGGDALRALLEYAWPGNVRELRNVIERAVIVAEGAQIRLCDLPSSITKGQDVARDEDPPSPAASPDPSDSPVGVASDSNDATEDVVSFRVGVSLEQVKRELILRTLEATGNNKSHAARILGISSKTIYNKVREWEGESLSA
jgi:DNA-binding NtrC family response regulator